MRFPLSPAILALWFVAPAAAIVAMFACSSTEASRTPLADPGVTSVGTATDAGAPTVCAEVVLSVADDNFPRLRDAELRSVLMRSTKMTMVAREGEEHFESRQSRRIAAAALAPTEARKERR